MKLWSCTLAAGSAALVDQGLRCNGAHTAFAVLLSKYSDNREYRKLIVLMSILIHHVSDTDEVLSARSAPLHENTHVVLVTLLHECE